MAIITLKDIHKSFGSEVVLDHLNLQLFAGEKLGMLGPNGCGKSTIFKLILGALRPDIGEVIKQKGLRIGYLAQETSFNEEHTVLEEMHAGVDHILALQQRLETVSHELSDLSELGGSELNAKMQQYDRLTHEFELAGGYAYETRIKTTLAGLGFDPELHHVKTSALSGGQLSRLGLAQVLMLETNLLLLDEPTNHLDLQATEWLERFINNYNGAVVVISHDRYLLDKIATKIVEVENGEAHVWRGNYTNYMETRETVRLQEEREHTRRVEMVKRTEDFIARNKDQEGMRGTARGRKTRLEKMLKENPDYLEVPFENRSVNFSFQNTDRQGDLVLRCEGVAKSFGDLTLFSDLDLEIEPSTRWGITGPNGTGKSTLLNLLLNRLEPTAGQIRRGVNLSLGYLDQHGDVLNPEHTVLEAALEANPAYPVEQVRNRLGAFLFTGDDVFKQCGDLSGGQRNRLMLCRLVLGHPDVMIMDEPTNHLDIDSREMLETALDAYNGTLIVVSHDRYFLDRVVDHLLLIGVDAWGQRCLGQKEVVHGKPTYTYYAAKVSERLQGRQETANASRTGRKRRSASAQKKVRPKTPEELKRFNKFTVEQIEEQIMDLEEAHATLKERFGNESVYKDPIKLAALQEEFDNQTIELKLLYRAYEYKSD
ncbi:ribosomal protection-like ABC-F family protein [Planctomycetota bacterium]